jgi:hypothetical protein
MDAYFFKESVEIYAVGNYTIKKFIPLDLRAVLFFKIHCSFQERVINFIGLILGADPIKLLWNKFTHFFVS